MQRPFKYRCFDRLDITVGQYHVLAGANGTGSLGIYSFSYSFSPYRFRISNRDALQ
ncbi:MAG: hypothetical protein KME29_37320 [Calothrix sp. FI2-JRJ7]|nr:hypothetical protein [Calothrix sp. FI2-JRJ7]